MSFESDDANNQSGHRSGVTERLARELPLWSVSDGCLQRTYTTSGWKGTLLLVNAIGHLAEVAWHHPDLKVSYKNVIVNLVTHSEGKITDMDFELAAKIESVVQWQPATESGALTGTPKDPRYDYIQYD